MTLASVISIIPESVMAQRKAEQAALDSARNRAEQLIRNAEREADLLRQNAYEAGLAEGRRQALVRHTELAQQLMLFRDAAKEQMADVFLQGLNHVLAGPARQEYFSNFIEEAQQLLGRMRFARLLVHPNEEALLRSLAQQSSLGHSDSPVSIECDADIPPGSCALVSDAGKVSVSMQSRLEDVRAVLAQVFATVDITVADVDANLLKAPSRWEPPPETLVHQAETGPLNEPFAFSTSPADPTFSHGAT